MLSNIVNQISANSTSTSPIPYNEIGLVGTIVAIGYVGFESGRRTWTKAIQTPKESFIDDSTGARTDILDIELKFRDNPFFKRITLFEYEGSAKYKISGSEFNTYQTVLSEDLFYDWNEQGKTKVMIIDKTHFKKRKIKHFRVCVEKRVGNYRKNIHETISSSSVKIENDNELPIQNYVFSLPRQTDVTRLRMDSNINDVFLNEPLWLISIKELPAKGINSSGTFTIQL